MFKNSILALALIAALTSGSQALAAQFPADLVVSSAAVSPIAFSFEVTVTNQGRRECCASLLEVQLLGTAADKVTPGLISLATTVPALAAGESKTLMILIPDSMRLMLQMWSSQIVYFRAITDCHNDVNELGNVEAAAGAVVSINGEINNTTSFNYLVKP